MTEAAQQEKGGTDTRGAQQYNKMLPIIKQVQDYLKGNSTPYKLLLLLPSYLDRLGQHYGILQPTRHYTTYHQVHYTIEYIQDLLTWLNTGNLKTRNRPYRRSKLPAV